MVHRYFGDQLKKIILEMPKRTSRMTTGANHQVFGEGNQNPLPGYFPRINPQADFFQVSSLTLRYFLHLL